MSELPLLELKGAHVRYGSEGSGVSAIQGVDLKLSEGQCLGIAGESGCGKSTLSHLISGLLPEKTHLTYDSFNICGQEAPALGSRAWRKLRGSTISMIFQDPIGTLNPFWTIGQQLKETLKFHGISTTKANSTSVAGEWLEKVHISDPGTVLERFPHQLSGGMCQRVNLALALCTQPKILIADEPTTALDVTTQKTVLDLIANLSKESGMAVLLVSHDLGALSERSDKLMVMYAGKAMEWGATSEIMTSPSHPYTRALLKAQPPISGPLPDKLELIHGQPPRLSKQHELCPFLNRCPSSIEACQKTMPSINGKSTHRRMCHLEDN